VPRGFDVTIAALVDGESTASPLFKEIVLTNIRPAFSSLARDTGPADPACTPCLPCHDGGPFRAFCLIDLHRAARPAAEVTSEIGQRRLMSMMGSRVVAWSVILLLPTCAAAQVGVPPSPQGMPPRDRPAAAQPAGTAVIQGRVIDAQTGVPLARARVRLMPLRTASAPDTLTDEAGSFTFPALPAGNYMLSAEKSTYMVARYPEGGQTLRTSARPFALADGQALRSVTLAMYHGGVIAGRVLDAHGDPFEYANIQVLKVPPGGGRPQQRSGAATNDLGEFRAAHLDPGKYFLLVQPRVNRGNNPGQPGQPDLEPLPTFYPGAPSIDQAQPIAIGRGESVTGADITLIESYAASIDGTVVDLGGRPACCGGVNVRPIVRDIPNFGTTGAGVQQDGTFHFRLPPGEYELEVNLTPPGRGGPAGPGNQLFGHARISVAGGGDPTAVTITVGPGAKVSGRLVFDGTSPPPTVAANNPNGLSLALGPGSEGFMCRAGRAQLAADGTFGLDNVFGTCVARVQGNLSGWTVKSIQYEGKELMDQPVAFEPGTQLKDVRIVLSDKHTELTLQVTDDNGQPTSEFVGIIFSADKTRWTQNSRYIRTYVPPSQGPLANTTLIGPPGQIAAGVGAGGGAGVSVGVGASATLTASSPGSTGLRNIVRDLPPGDYLAVAVDDIAMEAVRDPTLLEQLARAATRLSLVDGSPVEAAVRRVKLADLPYLR
jgi:hypothetical protein